MTDPVATAQDVSDRIPTGLETGEIDTYLSDAVFDLEQEFDLSGKSDDWRRQVEWRLAAYKILTLKEKETTSEQRNSVSVEYAESRIEELRQQIEDLTDGKLASSKPEASFEVY